MTTFEDHPDQVEQYADQLAWATLWGRGGLEYYDKPGSEVHSDFEGEPLTYRRIWDSWLDNFEVALKYLNKPTGTAANPRTLAEELFPEEDMRNAVIRKYEELDALAAAVQATPFQERDRFSQERIDLATEDAYDMYTAVRNRAGL